MTVLASPTAPTVTVSPLTPPLAAPLEPVITHGGTLGTTAYGYIVTAINRERRDHRVAASLDRHRHSATLSGVDWNIVSWSAVPAC